MRARCIVVCCAVVVATMAQSRVSDADAPLDANQSAAMERAQRLRRVGMGLSLTAVALEAATIALWGGAVAIMNSRTSEYGADPPAYWPVLGLAVGTTVAVPLLLCAGVPLWSIGSRRIKALERRHVTLSPTGVIRF